MSNVVIIGAGQTGRGYLNRFFQSESITFLDKDVIMYLLDLVREDHWHWRITMHI